MIYRKQGRVVRWENGTLIRVSECGAAREDGELFECWPISCGAAAASAADDFAGGRERPPLHKVAFERVIFSRGYAEHEYGDKHWNDHTERFHASLVHGRYRALVDRFEDLDPIAEALTRVKGEREPPRHLRLAPNVSAAVLPFLADARQTAGGVDGYGEAITETSVNFYRPSYRVRPVRTLFNLHLPHDNTPIDEDLPRAIALLAPASGVELRVLVEDGPRVYATTIRVGETRAIAAERIWYPYGAGSFGAEMML